MLLKQFFESLQHHSYVKLITGASLTDVDSVVELVQAYQHTGIACVDVAADLPVVNAVAQQLEGSKVALMVSFPLDEDPHFRKIELERVACIDCGACLADCPTQVFSMPNGQLELNQPLCYGCGRCLPVCPANALSLDPFDVLPQVAQVLAHSAVVAVEIHSKFADPVMVDDLFNSFGSLLSDKVLSICLQPQAHPPEQVLAFLQAFQQHSNFPLIIQVDGVPMSGSLDPNASVPALNAAVDFLPIFDQLCQHPNGAYLTISGGINAETAQLWQQPQYQRIHGVGIGSSAKAHVWPHLHNNVTAQTMAGQFIQPFLSRSVTTACAGLALL